MPSAGLKRSAQLIEAAVSKLVDTNQSMEDTAAVSS